MAAPTQASVTVLDTKGAADYVQQVTRAQYSLYQRVTNDLNNQLLTNRPTPDTAGYTAFADDLAGVNANYGKIAVPANLADELAAMVAANNAVIPYFRAVGKATTWQQVTASLPGDAPGHWVSALQNWRVSVGLTPG